MEFKSDSRTQRNGRRTGRHEMGSSRPRERGEELGRGGGQEATHAVRGVVVSGAGVMAARLTVFSSGGGTSVGGDCATTMVVAVGREKACR